MLSIITTSNVLIQTAKNHENEPPKVHVWL